MRSAKVSRVIKSSAMPSAYFIRFMSQRARDPLYEFNREFAATQFPWMSRYNNQRCRRRCSI